MHLCLESLYSHNVPLSRINNNGLKYYTIEIRGNNTRHVIFKDSLNFFFCPLSALPKVFGLDVVDKGHFPHLANRNENLHVHYNCLPPEDLYQPDHMMPKARAGFLEWYHRMEHQLDFLLSRDLPLYCANDVEILRAACQRFQALLEEIAGVDPFQVSSTIAKLALHVYRKKFLPPNLMVNAPEHGYRQGEPVANGPKIFTPL